MRSIADKVFISAGALVLAAACLCLNGRVEAADGGRRWLGQAMAHRASDAHAQAKPNSLVYVITGGQQFGAVDLRSGVFLPIGSGLPEDVGGGLVPGPGGSLLSLDFSGDLVSINPATGVTSTIGRTGLGDCSTAFSPCGLNSANVLGTFDGNTYAVDFGNNLYSVNTATGAAKLIGSTGIPALTFIPLSKNGDGSVNVYDETLFSAGGNFYANFGTSTVIFETGTVTPVIPDALYQIDPATGHATMIAFTDTGLSAIVNVNDTTYAFSAPTHQVDTLNLKNGKTHTVSDLDMDAGLIAGASPARPDIASGH